MMNEHNRREIQLNRVETTDDSQPIYIIKEDMLIDATPQVNTFKRKFTSDEMECRKIKKLSSKVVVDKRWVWKDFMVESLAECLLEYKKTRSNLGIHFESDLITMYKTIRRMMATLYPIDFGPSENIENIENTETSEMSEDELRAHKGNVTLLKKEEKVGYNRIKEKIKELRQGYKNYVYQNSLECVWQSSGGKRSVHNNFETLKSIWGEFPPKQGCKGSRDHNESKQKREATEVENLLHNEVESKAYEEPNRNVKEQCTISIEEITRSKSFEPHRNVKEQCTISVEEITRPKSFEPNRNVKEQSTISIEDITRPKSSIRKKAQKGFSLHQRKMSMLEIAREDLKIKKRTAESFEKYMQVTQQNMNEMTRSLASIASNVSAGLSLLTEVFKGHPKTQATEKKSY